MTVASDIKLTKHLIGDGLQPAAVLSERQRVIVLIVIEQDVFRKIIPGKVMLSVFEPFSKEHKPNTTRQRIIERLFEIFYLFLYLTFKVRYKFYP